MEMKKIGKKLEKKYCKDIMTPQMMQIRNNKNIIW